MQDTRKIDLRVEIATALAVLAMLLQVALAPLVMQQHAYSVSTDYGLTVICGHQQDTSPESSDLPASVPHLHDCPCCLMSAGHAVLPVSASIAAPALRLAYVGETSRVSSQITETAPLSEAQRSRAPPSLG